MAYKTLLVAREGPVATIAFNGIDPMNSLTLEVAKELGEAMDGCEVDPSVRAVVLTGQGLGFCVGADLRVVTAMPPEEAARYMYELGDYLHEHVVVPMRRMAKPVIGAVNGVAAGGGFGLALACDYRIAAETARFTVAYSNIAVCPDCSTTFFLPRLVGVTRALQLYMFNDMLSAEQALQTGLVSRVVPGSELVAAALADAKRLASGPTFAYGQTKDLFNRAFANDLAAQLKDEARAICVCAGTADFREGIAAFAAKPPASFVGH